MLFCMTTEQRTAALLGEVRAEMARRGLNLTSLAEATGMSQASLSRKLRGETGLMLADALVVCDALHVTLPALLRRVDEMAAA